MKRGIKKRLAVLRTMMATATGSGSAQKPVVLNNRAVDYFFLLLYCNPCEGPVCLID